MMEEGDPTLQTVAAQQQRHGERLSVLETEVANIKTQLCSIEETLNSQFSFLCKHLGIPVPVIPSRNFTPDPGSTYAAKYKPEETKPVDEATTDSRELELIPHFFFIENDDVNLLHGQFEEIPKLEINCFSEFSSVTIDRMKDIEIHFCVKIFEENSDVSESLMGLFFLHNKLLQMDCFRLHFDYNRFLFDRVFDRGKEYGILTGYTCFTGNYGFRLALTASYLFVLPVCSILRDANNVNFVDELFGFRLHSSSMDYILLVFKTADIGDVLLWCLQMLAMGKLDFGLLPEITVHSLGSLGFHLEVFKCALWLTSCDISTVFHHGFLVLQLWYILLRMLMAYASHCSWFDRILRAYYASFGEEISQAIRGFGRNNSAWIQDLSLRVPTGLLYATGDTFCARCKRGALADQYLCYGCFVVFIVSTQYSQPHPFNIFTILVDKCFYYRGFVLKLAYKLGYQIEFQFLYMIMFMLVGKGDSDVGGTLQECLLQEGNTITQNFNVQSFNFSKSKVYFFKYIILIAFGCSSLPTAEFLRIIFDRGKEIAPVARGSVLDRHISKFYFTSCLIVSIGWFLTVTCAHTSADELHLDFGYHLILFLGVLNVLEFVITGEQCAAIQMVYELLQQDYILRFISILQVTRKHEFGSVSELYDDSSTLLPLLPQMALRRSQFLAKSFAPCQFRVVIGGMEKLPKSNAAMNRGAGMSTYPEGGVDDYEPAVYYEQHNPTRFRSMVDFTKNSCPVVISICRLFCRHWT